jgi:hypothetical protein
MKLKVFLLTLTLVMTSATSAKAQVTIGMREEPSPGSLLDLKEMSAADNTTATKGLGLPRVGLSDLNRLYPMLPAGYSDEEKAKHIGLVVYNVNRYANNRDVIEGEEYDPTGLRVWDGSRWQPLKRPVTPIEEAVRIDYTYTGEVQTFTAPQDGDYLLEAWGAAGGGPYNSTYSGYGGYVGGVIHLKETQTLYIYAGQRNNARQGTGIFNGGGITTEDSNSGRGGGATDFRLVPGDDDTEWNKPLSLNSRILVAGGGSGCGDTNSNSTGRQRGHAGGLNGWNSKEDPANGWYSRGGTQTAGGTFKSGTSGNSNNGQFGKGGDAFALHYLGGGGGGWYGGAGTGYANLTGSGGSSFISGKTGCVAIDPTDITNDPRTQDTGANTTALNYHSSFGPSPTWADGTEVTFIHSSMIDGGGYDWNAGVQAGIPDGMPNPFGGAPLPEGNTNAGRARVTLLVPVQ